MKNIITTFICIAVLFSTLSLAQKLEFKDRLFEQIVKKANSGDSASEFALGETYYLGFRGKKDYEKAIEWFEKAAVQGHRKAQYNLGYIYFVGKGVDSDMCLSYKWFEKAASATPPDPKAFRYLAQIHEDGLCVDKDLSKAFSWYDRAAKAGYPESQYIAANFLLDGRGVQVDIDKALLYLQKSSMQRFADAQFQLGVMYLHGDRVSKNESKGKRLIKQAAKNGLSKAKKLLEEL